MSKTPFDMPPSGPSTPRGPNQPDNTSSIETTASVSHYLESLTRSLIEAVNTRQFESHPSSQNLSPNVECFSVYSSPTNTTTQYFSSIRALVATYPHYQSHLTDVKAHVNLRAGYADVYTKMVATGVPPGVVRNSVCVLEFRLKGSVWQCVKMTGIRGMPHDGREVGEGYGA